MLVQYGIILIEVSLIQLLLSLYKMNIEQFTGGCLNMLVPLESG